MKHLYRIILSTLLLLPFSAAAKSPAGPDTLKVISYNIRTGEANDGTNSWDFRYPATILMLRDEKPDVFGLQEAMGYQVKFIEENMKEYKAFGVGRENGKDEGEFMSIFYNKSKVKIGKKGTFWLSEQPDKPTKGWDAACKRTATWAFMKMKRSKQEFIYVNTHLDHKGEEARREGLALIVRKIAAMNPQNLPVILTGDFNVEPGDSCLEALTGKMVSTRKIADKTDQHATFNDWGRKELIIDYIYESGFTKVPEFETVTKKYENWKYISDHFPISATLIF